MDWADDIAYAVHDLEDFYRAGLIPLNRLTTSKIELADFLEAERDRQTKAGEDPPDLAELESALLRPLTLDKGNFKGPYTGTQRERAMLREFASKLIGRYMDAIKLDGDIWGEDSLAINKRLKLEVETLKGLTWYYVIESQALASQRFGQRNVIRTLFEMYANAAFSGRSRDGRIFPTFFREMLKDADSDEAKLRVVSDTIASMSEPQALEIYQRLTGLSIESALMRPPL
jgi:dGTPase